MDTLLSTDVLECIEGTGLPTCSREPALNADLSTGLLQPGQKSPMEYLQETEPVKVEGLVVASHGGEPYFPPCTPLLPSPLLLLLKKSCPLSS